MLIGLAEKINQHVYMFINCYKKSFQFLSTRGKRKEFFIWIYAFFRWIMMNGLSYLIANDYWKLLMFITFIIYSTIDMQLIKLNLK